MITREAMGTLPCGKTVEKFTLKNTSGAYAEISTLGGCILSIVVPDKSGALGDVTLGYGTLDAMRAASGYMGYLIGRFGNRIGGAAFTLNGKEYKLFANDGKNHLHGGKEGFDKRVWDAEIRGESLVLHLVSPDGDEGYPGTLTVEVTYVFSESNALSIDYAASCDADTILNLTNHVYFNLAGPGCESISDHEIQINADLFTEVADAQCIPTGRHLPVDGTPFDLRKPLRIGDGLAREKDSEQMLFGGGYDHNFVLRGWDLSLRQAAIVSEAQTGRSMEVWTDQPGIQFYGGNMIAGETKGKCGVPYVKRQGMCLETQRFPDSIHHPDFPSCVLKKGEAFHTRTEYRFSLGAV